MRYGIFSDIHANQEALDSVLSAYERESIDKYVCTGDVVGYAANPKECIAKIRDISSIVVAGNHDWAAVSLTSVDNFNSFAREAIYWTRMHLDNLEKMFLESLKLIYEDENIIAVHGTLDNPQEFNYMNSVFTARETFRLLSRKICFLGHTHKSGVFIQNNKTNNIKYQEEGLIKIEDICSYIVNVGSLGQPRDGNPDAAYCIFDTNNKTVDLRRKQYNVSLSSEKIIQAGLPRYLGQRLFLGM